MHGVDASPADAHGQLQEDHIDAGLFGAKGRIHYNQIDWMVGSELYVSDISQNEAVIGSFNLLLQHLLCLQQILFVKFHSHYKTITHPWLTSLIDREART